MITPRKVSVLPSRYPEHLPIIQRDKYHDETLQKCENQNQHPLRLYQTKKVPIPQKTTILPRMRPKLTRAVIVTL